MKRTFLAAALFLCGAPVISGAAVEKAEESKEKKPPVKKIPYIPLHGSIEESPSELAMLLSGSEARTLRTLLARLEKARTDPDVPAVALSLGQPYIGWAQMQELRQAIEQLKASDKEVHVFLENATPGKYLLASAGSHVTVVPAGDVMLLGMFAEQVYFRGLFDWLGLEADMIHMGAYRGAAEPFTRTGPSPEAKEQTQRLVGDLYEQMVEMTAKSRSLSKEAVKAFMDSGKFTAQAALEAKLIDAVGYRQDFLKRVQDQYGEHAEIRRNYGVKKGPDFDFSNPFAALRTLGKLFQSVVPSKKTSIAVIYVDGPIMSGPSVETLFGMKLVGSSTLRKAFDDARHNDAIKAVVLRINSPGGSALASDIIWNAAERLAKEKPFIVSMGNVAASGGYYIACGAKTIFAEPGTITGSIGVVGGKIVTMPMWNKIGLTFDETKFGKYADIMNTNRRFSDEERGVILKWMDDVYGNFKERVVAGRKDRLKGKIEDLAGGRVYTGRQALAKGLVDQLGGLKEAIHLAAKEAKIEDYAIRILPEPKSFLDLFMQGIGGSDPEEVRSDPNFVRDVLSGGSVGETLRGLRRLDPAKVAALVRGLAILQGLREESVLTAWPGEILIR